MLAKATQQVSVGAKGKLRQAGSAARLPYIVSPHVSWFLTSLLVTFAGSSGEKQPGGESTAMEREHRDPGSYPTWVTWHTLLLLSGPRLPQVKWMTVLSLRGVVRRVKLSW